MHTGGRFPLGAGDGYAFRKKTGCHCGGIGLPNGRIDVRYGLRFGAAFLFGGSGKIFEGTLLPEIRLKAIQLTERAEKREAALRHLPFSEIKGTDATSLADPGYRLPRIQSRLLPLAIRFHPH